MSFGFGFSFPQLFGSSGAAPVSTDASFPYVSLLTPGNGTNAAQNNTFLDSSTNNFTITRNGTPTQGTFTPFSQTGWGGYFNSATSDYLTTPSNAALLLDGSFTVECWVYLNAATTGGYFSSYDSTTTVGVLLGLGGDGFFRFKIGTDATVGNIVLSSASIITNTWYHLAAVLNGTTMTLYVNGVSVGTPVTKTVTVNTSQAYIGRYYRDISNFYTNGYISNLRVVKGVAVYTGAFTPPTAPLTITQSAGTNISAITGTQTSLLTLQSNYYKDQTAAALVITPSGTPSIQAFSPFEPTAAYSAATNGGAAYFNGSTDSLTTPTSTAFNIGAGDFTIEGWWNFSVLPVGGVNCNLFGFYGVTTFNPYLYLWGDGTIVLNTAQVSGNVFSIASGFVVGNWYHLALVRSVNTYTLYKNGVSLASGTSTSVANENKYIIFGDGGFYLNGYTSSIRAVKGTAVYTANFTPPTAPLTAITNTSLLLSGTNAGIIDNAAKNAGVTTVGNAQISTAQSQWGGGSMLFDGTGDWVTVLDTPVLRFGTGDFTVEGWVYKTTTGTAVSLVSKGAAATGWTLGVSATNFLTASYTATTLTGTVTTLSANVWYYFALVRSGTATGNIKLYINGTLEASSATAITTDFNQTDVLYIGASRTATTPLTGYIDDLRITKAARTVTTTPTAAFPLY